jgi:hypothetical protein
MSAEIKSRGETVRIGATRGRYQLLARLIGKKEAKALLRESSRRKGKPL